MTDRPKRLIYPLELIATGMRIVLDTRFKQYDSNKDASWRVLVPYQIVQINEKWLPLNREYKPLGLMDYNQWADYEGYDFLLIPSEEIHFCRLRQDGHITPGYYFYDDTTTPDTASLKKIYIKRCLDTFPSLKSIWKYPV